MPQAVPRYSPVGSKASVHPNSGDSSRIVPPFVGAPEPELDAVVLLLLQATATRANVTPNAAAASRLRPITGFTPFSTVAPNLFRPCYTGLDHVVASPSTLPFLERSAPRARVEGIPEAVPQEVEGQRRYHEEHPGEEEHPPRDPIQRAVGCVREHPPPGRGARRDTDGEERQRGLEQDVLRDQQRRHHDDRGDHVRKDLSEHDVEVAVAGRPSRLDELSLPERQGLPSDDTGDVGPSEQRDDPRYQGDPGLDETTEAPRNGRAASGAEADRQQQERQRQHDVDQPGDEGIQLSTAEPGDQPQRDPDDERDARGHDRDQQGRPRTVEGPDEDVATETVDPEPRDLARAKERHADVARVILVQVVRPTVNDELRERRCR